ncbi:MAG TPA: MgtC/SapB family protein [Armatimonadota bacterium]|nr:MgtC/SapB family protein [Armatimonadota bacterium]
MFLSGLSTPEVLAKLLIAVVLGGAVGWERETLDRPAGFRTHVLVCVGSAVYMMVSESMVATYAHADPGRIAAQVASGMGFLGAGTILRHGNIVRGLTTAASLWTVAAIGLCIAHGGQTLVVAVLASVMVLLTLTLLGRVEKGIVSKRQYRLALIRAPQVRRFLPQVKAVLDSLGARIQSVEVVPNLEQGQEDMSLVVRLPPGVTTEMITLDLMSVEGLSAIQWE